MTDRPPPITPVAWLPASQVLGTEAGDFTPWLSGGIEMAMLGTALNLEDLTAVATEHNIFGKRLDILASAIDENGEEIPVCIENQYGVADADHLGRLIAYLSQHERGRAVWIVEKVHEAYVSAVRFLNRTSNDEVGYYLVEVKFTHGVSGAYQVHFEVVAAPIAWEKGSGPAGAAGRPVNEDKVAYLDSLAELIEPKLRSIGFAEMNTHARGSYLWINWPRASFGAELSKRLNVRVTRDRAVVAIIVNRYPTKVLNVAAGEQIRSQRGEALELAMPAETQIRWDASGSGLRKVIRCELAGGGYTTGDLESAAAWAGACIDAWKRVLDEKPIVDLDERVGFDPDDEL